jgi:hypothetical protein
MKTRVIKEDETQLPLHQERTNKNLPITHTSPEGNLKLLLPHEVERFIWQTHRHVGRSDQTTRLGSL